MKLATVAIAKIAIPAWAWRLSAPEQDYSLRRSLETLGQLTPLVVREIGKDYEVIDGRRRLQLLRDLNVGKVMVASVGTCSDEEAITMALTLELRGEIDYVALARQITQLSDVSKLSAITPWSTERIEYFRILLSFDWGVFNETSQTGFFDEEEQEQYISGTVPEDVPLTPQPEPPRGGKKRPERVVPLDLLEFDFPEPSTPAVEGSRSDDLPLPPVSSPSPGRQNASETLLDGLSVSRKPDHPVTPEAVREKVLKWDPLSGEEDPFAPFVPEPPEVPASEGSSVPRPRRVSIMVDDVFTFERPKSSWRAPEPPVLDGVKSVELDCETTGLEWYKKDRPIGIALRTEDGRKFYLPWGHASGNLDEATVKRWAQRELRDKLITNTNTRFDIHMMREWGVDLEEQGCTFADVQHYAALLDEYRKKFNVGDLARDFGVEARKTGELINKTDMASYDAGRIAEYAMNDVELVAQLREKMWPEMTKQDLHRVRALEESVIPVVVEMEKNAAFVDTISLRRMVEQSAEELRRMLFTVAREVGFTVNPDKSEDWGKLFYHFGIPVTQYTEPSEKYPQGQPSFADSVLAGIDHPTVQLLRRAGKLSSLRSKFLTVYQEVVGDDDKLRFALHQLRGDEYGTIRGRFSMSGGGKGEDRFGANLQQVYSVENQREAFGFNRDDSSHDAEIYIVRSLFIPEDGVYLGSDAQSIEYRLAAHFAEAKSLLKAYEADWKKIRDPRLRDGTWVDFHAVVQNIVKPYKDIGRKLTKNLNFLRIYGGGEEKAAATLKLPLEETRKILAIYDKKFPEFSDLRRRITTRARKRGFVTTLLGRRARFESEAFTHAAINYVIQGSAADIMKQKLVELHKERKWTGFVMRQTVHDEVDGDATMPETEARVEEVLNRQSFDTKVPIVWQTKTGVNWSEC